MRCRLTNQQRNRRRWRGTRLLAAASTVLVTMQIGATAQVSGELGRELQVGRRVPSAAPGGQGPPALAHGAGSYLAVWAEAHSFSHYPSYGKIVARRLQLDAHPRTQPTVSLARAQYARSPDVAYGAGRYLVIYLDDLYGAGKLKMVRLDEEGKPLDREPVALAPERNADDPQVVWRGDDFLVSWSEKDQNFSRTQHGIVVDETGSVQMSSPVKLMDGQADDVVAGPSGEILVLGNGSAQRFDRNLQPIGSPTRVDGGEMSGVFDGQRYFLAWDDRSGYPETHVRAAFLTSDGVLGDSRSLGTYGYFTGNIEAVNEGSAYAVMWNELHDDVVYARRVGLDGAVLDDAPIALYTEPGPGEDVSFEASASREGSVLVADAVIGRKGDNIMSAWLDPTAETGSPPRLVSRSANGQRSPAFASTGNVGLVVWQDWRHTYWEDRFTTGTPEKPTELYFARLRGGRFLPAGGRRLSSGSEGEYDANVAWTGRRFVAAWLDQSRMDIVVRQVAVTGEVGPTRVISGPYWEGSYPRVAGSAGRAYLVSQTDAVYPETPQLEGRLIDRRGRIGSRRVLSEQGSDGLDVITVGRRFVVVWSGRGNDDRLYMRTVGLDGKLSAKRTIARAPDASNINLATGSGRLMVTWTTPQPDGQAARIVAAVFEQNGYRLRSKQVITQGAFTPAEVAWDGEHFVMSVQRLSGQNGQALQVLKLNASGRVLARESLHLGRLQPGLGWRPAVAKHDGRVRVLYERYAPEPIYGGVNRIFMRKVR